MTGRVKRRVQTKDAPAAIGPYSQGIVSGGFLFVSGQIPIVPGTGEILKGSIEEETEQVLKNVLGVLKAADVSSDDVVKTTIFIKDMNQFAAINQVYAKFFKEPYPARSTVEVARLPKDVRIEIEVIAKVSG